MPRLPSRISPRLSVILIVLCLPTLLAAQCQTPGIGTAAKPEKSVACQLYGRAATYSKSRDTKETVRIIQRKNQAFKNYGCNI